MRDFVKRNALDRNVAYYVARRSGRDWYVLLYGNYKTRAAARRAVGKLPAAVKANQPFPRTFDSVQKSIRGE